jgi:hypothetical protein
MNGAPSFIGAVGEVGVGGGEGGEVVRAEDVRGGLVEGGERERPGTGPDIGGEGWRADAVLPLIALPPQRAKTARRGPRSPR